MPRIESEMVILQSPYPVGVSVWRGFEARNQFCSMLKLTLLLDDGGIRSAMRQEIIMNNTSSFDAYRNTIARVGGKRFTVDEGLEYLIQWFREHPRAIATLQDLPFGYRDTITFLSENGVM
jgi:hypothetical protein